MCQLRFRLLLCIVFVASAVVDVAATARIDSAAIAERLRRVDSIDPTNAIRSYGSSLIASGQIRQVAELAEYLTCRYGIRPPLPVEEFASLLFIARRFDPLVDSTDASDLIGRIGSAETIVRSDFSDLIRIVMIRSRPAILSAIKREGMADGIHDYLLLLYNRLIVRGVRTIDEHNRSVDTYVASHSSGHLADMVDKNLRLRVVRQPISLGLVVGYLAGARGGSRRRGGESLGGPILGGRIEFDRLALGVEGTLVRGSTKEGATTLFLGASAIAAYDLLPDLWIVRPRAGLSIGRMRDDVDSTEDVGFGYLFGIEFGRSIEFDEPPQLEWRLTLDHSVPFGYDLFEPGREWRIGLALILSSRRLEAGPARQGREVQ